MRLHASQRGALLAVLVSGCSLLQLDDFDRPRCQSDAECAEHTRAAGADPARCRVFLCNQQSGHCERAAAEGAERCDGEDNNCDAEGFIDEGAHDPPVKIKGDADLSDTTLAYAPGPNGAAYAVVLGRSGAAGYRVVDGLPQAPVPLAFDWHGSQSGEKNCPTADDLSTTCTFDEVALAAASEQLVTVAISTAGCAHGQVRIGTSTPDDPFTIWLSSKQDVLGAEQSSIALGVDVDVAASGLLCTGASRVDAVRGATLPAVASLEGSAKQTLALWLAAPSKISANSDVCLSADDTLPVEGLGVFASASNAWIEATWKGKPQPIGRTALRSAPAVVALGNGADGDVQPSALAPGGRFLVAFAVNDTEEPLAAPAEARRLQFSAVSFVPEPTAPLRFEVVGSLPDPGAHHIALSEGAKDRIGAVWRSGCDGAVALRFAELTWSSARNLVAPPPTELAVGNVVRGPFLVYSPAGFSAGRASGGWLVMWVERTLMGETELKLARVAEHESTLLETVTLATGRVDLTFPHRMLRNENAGSILDDEKSSIVGYSSIVEPSPGSGPPKARSAQCD